MVSSAVIMVVFLCKRMRSKYKASYSCILTNQLCNGVYVAVSTFQSACAPLTTHRASVHAKAYRPATTNHVTDVTCMYHVFMAPSLTTGHAPVVLFGMTLTRGANGSRIRVQHAIQVGC